MEPEKFYQKRLSGLLTQLKKLQKRKSSFAWLRLGAIAAIIFSLYLFWALGFWYVVTACVVLVFIFIRLIYADAKNQVKIAHNKQLTGINEAELSSLSENFYAFADGAEHLPKDHPYANDLDIFGRASLFQYINRTTSEMGSNGLADYLKQPAAINVISARQEAIKELSGMGLWRQGLQAFGREKPITFLTKSRLENWMKDPPVFSVFKPWKWLRYLLPLIILSVIFLYIGDWVGNGIFYTTLFVFAIIAYRINKYVAPVHEKLSKIAKELDTLSASIAHIENVSFKSPLLTSLQSEFINKNKKASASIHEIKKILDKLDLRYDMVLFVPLNMLLLWDCQQMLNLEKWKETQRGAIGHWFDSLADFEALNSLGTLHFNHPEWVFPTIKDEYFTIEGTEIGHPLIPKKKRVNNFINIPDRSKLMLVTGSNMAGKSTYLRSIGINVILAMAGAPVCAQKFSVSHVQVISSMRITDNLEESTSTFYAELKKLKTIIEKVNNNEKVFILLDEILRGTNSLDRHTGSKALIKQLIKKQAASIIATHDLELANLKETFSDSLLNFHFDVQVEKDELFFDYRLKPGVCNSLNASILMKKIGIEL